MTWRSSPATRGQASFQESDDLILKVDVHDFWNTASCGEIYAKGTEIAQRLNTQAEARYRLEPYIRPFARFAEGAGQDVLEVGVGMGADHLEWARSGPRRLAGVDLTSRALAWTSARLSGEGFRSELSQADAEHLPFSDQAFSLVYSWGVLHHSPDTAQTFREAYRVLRPGGVLRAMIYHRPSVVGIMLWAKYGLAAGRPARSMSELYACHLESPGTKGYSVTEARRLIEPFAACRIHTRISFADLLLGESGQLHMSRGLMAAKRIWPRPFIRALPQLGLLLLIEARK